MNLRRYSFLFVLIVFSIFIVLFLSQKDFYKQEEKNDSVKAIIIVPTIYTTPTLTPTSTPTPFVTPKKASYTIAFFGDSMVDTMGEKLEILQKEFYRSYPKTRLKLYNYGIGGQNIETGVARFESDFSNKERVYPPITAIKPDIIVLGTFAYNPFVPHDLEKYKAYLTTLIQKAMGASLNVYLLAEIGPKKTGFGEGEYGVNWPEDQAHQQAFLIIEQLKTAIAVASKQGVPIINAYQRSLIDDSFGNPIYVRNKDGIHPSYEGHILMIRAIISSLKFR